MPVDGVGLLVHEGGFGEEERRGRRWRLTGGRFVGMDRGEGRLGERGVFFVGGGSSSRKRAMVSRHEGIRNGGD